MKDTIISMSITLFILSVLVMAGTSDKTAGLSFEKLDQTYGYGYGYGYGTDRTTGSARSRDNSYTTTFSMKVVPANDGFDYNSIPRWHDGFDYNSIPRWHDGNWSTYNDTRWNDYEDIKFKRNNITYIPPEEKKPFPKTAVCGGLGALAILLALLMSKKKGDKK